jgi:hypothetical protein
MSIIREGFFAGLGMQDLVVLLYEESLGDLDM